MDNVVLKDRFKGQRGHVIRTQPWAVIAERFEGASAFDPMQRIVEAIAASTVHSELFAATSMWDLLLSDSPDFRVDDSTLSIAFNASSRQFHFRHISFSGQNDECVCAESEALPTLRLFLRLKFGVLFELPPAEPAAPPNAGSADAPPASVS